MKTFAELKAFCEKNNVRYEINPKRSDKWYNPYSRQFEDCILGWYFGMNNIAGKSGKSEYQWTWFYCYAAEKPTDESKFFFEERYSQVNGKSYKSVREEIQAEDCIERRMN